MSGPILGSGSISWTDSFEDGSYQWKARSIDKAGIWSEYSTERTVLFDSTPPDIPVLSPLPQTINQEQSSFTISGSKTTDVLTMQAMISYQLSSSSDALFVTDVKTSEWQMDNPIFEWKTADLSPDKPYYFRIKARDSAGNISNWSETTATTVIAPGAVKIPTIDRNGWGIADGVLADGLKPEKSRLTTGYVFRGASLQIQGTTDIGTSIEVFINDTFITKVLPSCSPSSCTYSYVHTFNDNGTNDNNGIPRNVYAFQVRAITNTGRTSSFSPKEIVYHDTEAPVIPDINVTSNNISLITNPITKELQMIVDTRSERHSDTQYYLNAPNGQVSEIRIWRAPYNKSSRLWSSMKLDGEYTLIVKATDAAGNTSLPRIIKLTRDTTPPNKPTVEPYSCDSSGCTKLL